MMGYRFMDTHISFIVLIKAFTRCSIVATGERRWRRGTALCHSTVTSGCIVSPLG